MSDQVVKMTAPNGDEYTLSMDQGRKAMAAALRHDDLWMPIETAPKDGTRVLVGRFTKGKMSSDRNGYMTVDWYRQPKDGAGFLGWGKFNTTYWPPTHWMPLPKRPRGT